ncbi:hypothetical protein P12x_001769 [Tundrisphaera lichenicola]|uniref:hypothetical protein n=1 Tax=Tundrisphaera lichenicola TaxID=2029860 RepID=UPI003EB8ABA9
MSRSALLILLTIASSTSAGDPFSIQVVDDQTGRGVPLVELRTVNEIALFTDSRGIVAFDEPGLVGQSVFFHVKSHGYEFPRDGFGNRGRSLDVVAGGKAQLKLRRINIAERLYRITGAGIYRDSSLVGDPSPIREPVLNAQVLGSDSVLNAVYRGRLHWFWGDTNRPGYPLGNFHTPTAVSRLPTDGGLDPDVGVDLDYSVGLDGFAAPSARMPGDGPTWLDGLSVLEDPSGVEHLFAAFAKIKAPMEVYARGLAEFDPETRRFSKIADIPLETPAYPTGHPFPQEIQGEKFLLFANPYPTIRVRAHLKDFQDLDRYEAFTCLLPGSTPENPRIDRDSEGIARYAWRTGSKPIDQEQQARLIKSGSLKPEEGIFQLRDPETDRPVTAHRGSVYWNDFRERWIMIATEIGGSSSMLGEVWFAEADTPLGPWTYARKVVTHDQYSFYNPKLHPYFAKEDGRILFFEGTYTATFSGNTVKTPRYDYNQIMYRLDLRDPRLNLPVPIYDKQGTLQPKSPGHPIVFFALDRPGTNTRPIGNPPRFYALSLDLEVPPSTTITLYQRKDDDVSQPTYFVEDDPAAGLPGRAIGRVWKNPSRIILPTIEKGPL